MGLGRVCFRNVSVDSTKCGNELGFPVVMSKVATVDRQVVDKSDLHIIFVFHCSSSL